MAKKTAKKPAPAKGNATKAVAYNVAVKFFCLGSEWNEVFSAENLKVYARHPTPPKGLPASVTPAGGMGDKR